MAVFEKDLENGSCTLEEAEELVEELFIRLDERVSANDLWNEMIITGELTGMARERGIASV